MPMAPPKPMSPRPSSANRLSIPLSSRPLMATAMDPARTKTLLRSSAKRLAQRASIHPVPRSPRYPPTPTSVFPMVIQPLPNRPLPLLPILIRIFLI